MAEFLDYPGLAHFYKLLKAEIDSASLSDRFTLGYETQDVGSQSYTVVTVWDQGDVNVGETSALFVDYTQKMVALPEGREATANDAKGWADVTIRFVATSDFDIQFNQVIHATGGIRCETGNEYLLKILGHHVILRTLKDWMDAEPSIEPTNGTLDIEGNLELSEDFKVNGSVIVTGDITGSGTLYATGTITCNGTTSATVKAGATLSECDISIDNGTTTFNSNTTTADGKVSVGGTGVNNAADCVVNCDMEIESADTGITNRGSFTVNGKLIITSISDGSNGAWGCGVSNLATFIVTETATVNITGYRYGITQSANSTVGTIMGTMTIIILGNVSGAACRALELDRGKFTVTTTGVIYVTSAAVGLYIDGAQVIVDGAMIITAEAAGVSISLGSLTGEGAITVNGEPYDF